MVIKDDEERQKWAFSLYGMDTADPVLYDMLLHIGALSVEDAARLVAQTARLPSFQMSPDAKLLLNDRVLASQIESLLLEEFPRVEVAVRNRRGPHPSPHRPFQSKAFKQKGNH